MSAVGWFELVYRHSLIYNQCWEDPAVDRLALRLTPADRILAITSAGCNVLDYALLGAQVTAVDSNPRQTHLLELKLAGIRCLDFEAFFALFGAGGRPDARALYRRLRPDLPPAARHFWDERIGLFDPRRAPGGSFYYSGTAGLFALAMRRYIDLVGARAAVDRILEASCLAEQSHLYQTELKPRLLGTHLFRMVGSGPVLSLLGVPGPQREMVRRQPGGFAGFLRACLDRVFALSLFRDNYFWRVYVTGRYSPTACPEYLKPVNFARLKAGLVENVRPVTATVTDFLGREGEAFTCFVLLDHMDWLASRPALLEEEWGRILARAAREARTIFRSGGPDAGFLPASVRARLRFDRERAAALHEQDRVGTYGSFHIARLAA